MGRSEYASGGDSEPVPPGTTQARDLTLIKANGKSRQHFSTLATGDEKEPVVPNVE